MPWWCKEPGHLQAHFFLKRIQTCNNIFTHRPTIFVHTLTSDELCGFLLNLVWIMTRPADYWIRFWPNSATTFFNCPCLYPKWPVQLTQARNSVNCLDYLYQICTWSLTLHLTLTIRQSYIIKKFISSKWLVRWTRNKSKRNCLIDMLCITFSLTFPLTLTLNLISIKFGLGFSKPNLQVAIF